MLLLPWQGQAPVLGGFGMIQKSGQKLGVDVLSPSLGPGIESNKIIEE